MQIELKAKAGDFIPLSAKAVLPDEITVEVKREVPCDHLILTVKSDAGQKDYNADKPANITEMCKTPGKVFMKLTNYSAGCKVNEWVCEPLVLTQGVETVLPLTFTEQTDERLATLEKTVSTLATAIKELYNLR